MNQVKVKKWSPTDPRHFEGKTINELQDRLVDAEHNEYRQELKRRIAEKIGK
jgi:hypothetical protein